MAAQLTFLFTDLENSTHLWQRAPVAMQDALARHDALMKAVVEQHNGRAAKADGRWENAYVTSEMKVPADFLAALESKPKEK